ncbi:hypothetical protein INR49_006038, partial [Caranx melampygus]
MPCGKNFRRRRDSSDVEEEETTEEVRSKVEEAKELQSLRKRQSGVSVTALLVGEKLPPEAEIDNDPFKLKTGGVVDMKKVKDRNRDMTEDETDLNLGTSFSAETNRRDEDADMMKYIETELKKRKGLVEAEEQKLSAKIKNIIQTEEAKAKLLAEQRNKKKDHGTSFVPTNIAVNYVQHNRFYHEDVNAPQRHHRHREEPKARPLRVGDTEKPGPEASSPPNYRKRPNNEKATDDYHYEKSLRENIKLLLLLRCRGGTKKRSIRKHVGRILLRNPEGGLREDICSSICPLHWLGYMLGMILGKVMSCYMTLNGSPVLLLLLMDILLLLFIAGVHTALVYLGIGFWRFSVLSFPKHRVAIALPLKIYVRQQQQ